MSLRLARTPYPDKVNGVCLHFITGIRQSGISSSKLGLLAAGLAAARADWQGAGAELGA